MRNEYTVAALTAPAAVMALEFLVLRTGLPRRPRFWGALAIVLAFQVPVDGWLTGGRAPVVSYSATAITGLRGPWRIPVEDFGFGLALAALTMLLWERAGRSARLREHSVTSAREPEHSVTSARELECSGTSAREPECSDGRVSAQRAGERHG